MQCTDIKPALIANSATCNCNYKPEVKTVSLGRSADGKLFLQVGERTFEEGEFEVIKGENGKPTTIRWVD